MKKVKFYLLGLGGLVIAFFSLLIIIASFLAGDGSGGSVEVNPFDGEFTERLPNFDDIEGKGQIDDEIAQYAYATSVKYQILPSVVLSQYAYESEWGKSQSAKEDNNFFGITWFEGSPFPKGSSRGVGGSEGGNYMKFPNEEEAFNYYGYMLASQDNFNAIVQEKDPAEALLTLGRGGYASAGISKSSAYFKGAMGIIKDNDLVSYDESATDDWGSVKIETSEGSSSSGSGDDLTTTAKEFEGEMTYSQSQRTNFGTPDKPKKNGNADCSSFVWLMMAIAGYKTPKEAFTTVTMADDAKSSQNYLKQIGKKSAKAGDVVIVNMGSGSGNNGHTAILMEDWKGKSTDIIQIGGVDDKINVDEFGTSFMSLLGNSDVVLARPIGK